MANVFRRVSRRRGVALIIVLSVLALISLMAIAFATLSTLERDISHNYLDEIRARLVARAGLEYATDQIMNGIQRGAPDAKGMQYWGSKVDETGSPDWVTPLELARNPSYAWEAEDLQDPDDDKTAPLLLRLDGKDLGFSGRLGTGTYSKNGDIFRLLVTDANSRIYVNDGVAQGSEHVVSKNLERILNNLGDVLQVQHLGKRILAKRPKEGYHAKKELEAILGRDDYRKAAPHLTVHAWIDSDLACPVPLSQDVLDAYPVKYNQRLGLFRYGRGRDVEMQPIQEPLVWAPEYADPRGVGHAINGLDEVNAQWIERVRRAPVNVNLASKEVLTALIVGLRGFFIVERRKHNPAADEYSFMLHTKYDNRPGAKLGDEFGFLYSTPAFVAKGGSGTQAASSSTTPGAPYAEDVAEEMIACRDRKTSPNLPGFSYGSAWFGGPFRSWRQFYAFCDNLAAMGLLRDARDIYYDYEHPEGSSGWSWGGGNPSGSDNLYGSPSKIQQDWAGRALADVLKANFNPNCTLNELNPDANLHLTVDKTDLICNSTEFCFTPMGLFEIESEGLLVRAEGGDDLMNTKRGQIVSRRKFNCLVKAYDALRETTQAQFYEGEASPRPGGTVVTNTNRTIEIGPEPDNGPAPRECRYSGYLTLATHGGCWSSTGVFHAKGNVESTPKGASERGDTMHGHFSYDCTLHHHADDARDIVRGTSILRNSPDRTEKFIGPYTPELNAPGHYRLARDYEDGQSPAADYVAPLDLRTDGAFVERDCALLYQISDKVISGDGTTAYWLKPTYRPEMTGKPRTYFSLDYWTPGGGFGMKQYINGQWFLPSADAPAYSASPNEGTNPIYPQGPWRPASFCVGYAPNAFGGVGQMTPSLNHRAHTDTNNVDLLSAHRWTHVIYHWKGSDTSCEILVNGIKQPGTADIHVHPAPCTENDWVQPGNLVRFGEPSKTAEGQGPSWAGSSTSILSRNWASDATLDEIYVWKGNAIQHGQDLWSKGRYYRARPKKEGAFLSRPLAFTQGLRNLPPPSSASAPAAGGGTVAQGRPATQASVPLQARILGTAWTWYPPQHSSDGKPQVRDYYSEKEIRAEVELQFVVNRQDSGEPMLADGGSYGMNLVVTELDDARYRFKIRLPECTHNSILLDTPAIDDVTIYYTTGVQYLSYEIEDTLQ